MAQGSRPENLTFLYAKALSDQTPSPDLNVKVQKYSFLKRESPVKDDFERTKNLVVKKKYFKIISIISISILQYGRFLNLVKYYQHGVQL